MNGDLVSVSQLPGGVEWSVVRGDNATLELRWVDGEGDPIDMSGLSLSARVTLEAVIVTGGTLVVDMADAAAGVVRLPLTSALSATLTGSQYEHILRDDTNGRTLIDGPLRMRAAGSAGVPSGTTAATVTVTNTNATVTITTSVGGSSGGKSDHGELEGLGDDDHEQYALADGSRGVFASVEQGERADSALQSIAGIGAGGALSGTYPNPGLNAEVLVDLIAARLLSSGAVLITYDDEAGTIEIGSAYNTLATVEYDFDAEEWPARPDAPVVRWIGPTAPPEGIRVDEWRTLEAPAVVTEPGAPTSVVAVAGDGQASLTWSGPTDDGGAAITGYTVVVYDDDGVPVGSPINTGDTDPSYVVTGLFNGTVYGFKVAAINSASLTGAQSDMSNEITPVSGDTVPGAPTGVSGVAGNAQATVSWSAPASDGGDAITNYVVTPYIGATAQTPTTVGNVLTTTITGLTNGTAYTFKVHAVNGVGAGADSTASSSVTPVAPASAPTFVQTSSIGEGGSGTTTVTATFGTAPTNGNTLVACQMIWSSTIVPNIPAGWALALERVAGSRTLRFLTMTAGASAPTGYTFTTPTGIHQGVVVYELTPAVFDVGLGEGSALEVSSFEFGPTSAPSAPVCQVSICTVASGVNEVWVYPSPWVSTTGTRLVTARDGSTSSALAVTATKAVARTVQGLIAGFRSA